MVILPLVVVGIVAAGMSGPVSILSTYIHCYSDLICVQTIMELSSTLHKYLDDQTVQETWNNLQENVILELLPVMMVIMFYHLQMRCCGVSIFTDYETVFNNFSVPVSCCNTSSPLASECPDIVRNSQLMINQTGLIYSDVSRHVSCLPTACVLISFIIGLCIPFGVILQQYFQCYSFS